MATGDIVSPDPCISLEQLIKRAFADPGLTSSDVDTAAKVSELRRCFDGALSRVLRARNASVLPVPDDVWLLVMDHLPLDDLLSASRACRTWRAVALANSRLWSRLTLRMHERGPAYITNIAKLQVVLPRSGSHLLQLDVNVNVSTRSYAFATPILDFLPLVAPRLVRLQLVATVPWLAGPILSDICTRPELRELIVPPPSTGCSGRDKDCWIVHLQGKNLPKLVDLVLHSDIRVSFSGTWPEIRSLRSTGDGPIMIEDLILSAGALKHLIFEWTVDPNDSDDGEDPPLSLELVNSLRVIPDVDVTAELAPTIVESAFDIFGRSTAPRLCLAFKISENFDYDGPLQPRPCSRLASTVGMTASCSADCSRILLDLDDGSGHATQISVRDVPLGDLHPPTATIDWALVPSLDSLDVLITDACLWPDLMPKFPSCPRLSEVVLNVRTRAEFDTLLAATAHITLPKAEILHVALCKGVCTTAEGRALQTALCATRVSQIGESLDGC